MKAIFFSLAEKKRGRQRDASSLVRIKLCLKVLAVISPPFLTSKCSFMRVPKESKSFHDFVNLHGRKQLIKSLKQAHDHLLYDCCLTIDSEKKEVLHDLKLLADHLKRLPSQ